MLDAFFLLASVAVGFAMGYDYRKLTKEVKDIQDEIAWPPPTNHIAVENKTKPKHTASVVDGDDPVMAAKIEYEERFAKLNPEIHHEDK
jgi:hypothetical protein